MKISEYLRKEHIFLDSMLADKDEILKFVADACAKNGIVKNSAMLYKGLQNREQTMSTGVGGGIGFPHTTNTEAKDAAVILVRLAKPVDFAALDALPVDIILSIVIPENKKSLHIQILARVSRLCQNPEFLEKVRQINDPETLWKEIRILEETITLH